MRVRRPPCCRLWSALAGGLIAAQLLLPAVARGGEAEPASLFRGLLGPDAEVPFPFGRLLDLIRAQLDPAAEFGGMPVVLIPLGRSLQRHAAGTEGYFRFPRVVVAVTGGPRLPSKPLLRDRLYLGYHERAAVLEVISYNEDAGRFEFEVVDDYRAGGRARLRSGNRPMCLGCHQNQAPIFPRQTWDETSASRSVKALLELTGKDYYGLPWRGGVDVANAIDEATDRANLFAVAQRIWQQGCGDGADGMRCRGRLLWLALRSRISGIPVADQELDDPDLLPLRTIWRGAWGGAVEIPNPDLTNRLPLPMPPGGGLPAIDADSLRRAADVGEAFDPLELRPPLETWRIDEPGRFGRLVRALGDFVADADVAALEVALARTPAVGERRVALSCEPRAESRRRDYRCGSADGAELSARRDGERLRVDRLALPGGEVHYGLDFHGPDRLTASARPARAATGEALRGIEIDGDRMRLLLAEDLAPLAAAVGQLAARNLSGDGDALAGRPLRRPALLGPLLSAFGIRGPGGAASMVPLARDHGASAQAPDGDLAPWYRHCGACHDVPDAFPPGFLRGEAAAVRSRIDSCAPRMLRRLQMWDSAPGVRQKSPMPPPASAQAAALRASPDLPAMRAWLAERLRTRGIDPALLPEQAYADLPACAAY